MYYAALEKGMANHDQLRILIVDDNEAIHNDFRKVFCVKDEFNELSEAEQVIFGSTQPTDESKQVLPQLSFDYVYQGTEALDLVKKNIAKNIHYAVAFIDIRMPPGWDGILTIKKIWEADPDIQVVICTAYSDYSWREIIQDLGYSHNFLILKKPFDMIEIRQLVNALIKKWEFDKHTKNKVSLLHDTVQTRNSELEKTLSLLQAAFEATPDSTIAISQDKKIITYNKTFIKQWHISEKILQSELKNIIDAMAEQTHNAKLFKKMMNHLCENPDAEYIKEWKLTTGEYIELYIQPQILHDEIIGSVFSFRNITQRKRLEEELLYQTTHDGLTGLPNRILLLDRLQQAIVNANHYNSTIAILLIDLDNFKEVNDIFGKQIGDQIIKMIAERLNNHIEKTDSIIRLPGDEFLIILTDIKKETLLLEKVRELLDVILIPCKIEKHNIIVTGSMGISLYPKDGENPSDLLKNADAALYIAKESSQNSYQLYSSEFNEHIQKRAELVTALSQAVENKQLFLLYQPLYKTAVTEAAEHEICGMEALVRWHHPQLGTIYPNILISIAEETGLIIKIGEWVLREACIKAHNWQQTINPNLRIAINISGYQFRQTDFIQMIKTIIDETGIDPRLLELEMTESLLFKNIPETTNKMKELKKLGISIAIDDFGTGYATFSYLKHFPFDKVKIDSSFIKEIHENDNDAAIVEAIIRMTKRMKIVAVAEGVENQEQLDFLLKHHGDQVQGYYYSKPLSENEFTELLKNEQKRKKSQR